jgi:hypothetical protein
MEMVMGRTKSLVSALLFISATEATKETLDEPAAKSRGPNRLAKAAEIAAGCAGPTRVQAYHGSRISGETDRRPK